MAKGKELNIGIGREGNLARSNKKAKAVRDGPGGPGIASFSKTYIQFLQVLATHIFNSLLPTCHGLAFAKAATVVHWPFVSRTSWGCSTSSRSRRFLIPDVGSAERASMVLFLSELPAHACSLVSFRGFGVSLSSGIQCAFGFCSTGLAVKEDGLPAHACSLLTFRGFRVSLSSGIECAFGFCSTGLAV